MQLIVPSMSGTGRDTLRIYFVLNEWLLRRDYRDNGATIDAFVERVQRQFVNIPADSLVLDIYAGASPEGPPEWNRRLGERRGKALKNELQRLLGARVANYNIINEASRWEGFRKRIEMCNETWRDEVLNILDIPLDPRHAWLLSERELKLRALHGGEVWEVLLERYLPDFRSSGTAVIYVLGDVGDFAVFHEEEEKPKDYLPPVLIEPELSLPDIDFKLPPHGIPWPPAMAVKTNLPLWGIVAPNVQVEIPLGRTNQWSVEAEYIHPWWIWNHNVNAEQCMNFGVELRFWLGNRWWHPWLDGHHIGVAVGAGYYDFEYQKHKGYQGEYVNTYLNYGYQHRFNQRWAMDFGFGIGFIPTKYRYYEADKGDIHLIWQRTARFKWLGPTHANISLVYTFNLPYNVLSITQPWRKKSSRRVHYF